ncbi:MAG: hypothetical protein OXF73_10235, partial [Gammaproteobacteria bacterium]|nr:hypothetical protein [Gammaproteobacteria bacterium]
VHLPGNCHRPRRGRLERCADRVAAQPAGRRLGEPHRELRSDFGGAHLPRSGFRGNAGCPCLRAIAEGGRS